MTHTKLSEKRVPRVNTPRHAPVSAVKDPNGYARWYYHFVTVKEKGGRKKKRR